MKDKMTLSNIALVVLAGAVFWLGYGRLTDKPPIDHTKYLIEMADEIQQTKKAIHKIKTNVEIQNEIVDSSSKPELRIMFNDYFLPKR